MLKYFKQDLSNLSIKKCLFILFFILIINYIFFNYRILIRQNPYIAADWLINYSGGFIRRGFIGQIIFFFSKNFNISVIFLTFVISSSFFILFIYLFYQCLKNNINSKILIIYLFLPSTLLFTFFDPLAVGRKDSIILFFVTLYTYFLINNKINDNFIRLLLIITVVCLTLTHELVFFFIPYIISIKYLYLNNNSSLKVKKFFFEIILLVFSFICILLIFFFSHKHNNQILCESLLSLKLDKNICSGTIRDYKEAQSFNILLNYFKEFNYYNVYGLSVFLNFLPIIFSFICIKKTERNRSDVLKYINISFLCFVFTVPVFLFVNDWGRYFNIHFLFHALLFSFFLKYNNFNFKMYFQKYYVIKKILVLVILLLYFTSWNMPHCCQKKIQHGIYYFFYRLEYRLYDNSLETTKYGIDVPRLILKKLLNINQN